MSVGTDPQEATPPSQEDSRPLAVRVIDALGPGVLLHYKQQYGELTLMVQRERIREVLRALRDHPDLEFQFLADISSVDYLGMGLEPRWNVAYHLLSMSKRQRIRVKVPVPEGDEWAPSVTIDWPAANWLEREVYDLMGIRFEGHPDLRRILLPHDWQTHPLRKDEPLGEEPVAFSDNVPPNEPA
ncbi:MAG: NADH-quinone oxidoreductase subunit C [Chloroflexi bacterium]|nr:NADH-quinone oxidoreductase subunit C [Chloroflexota bacterium]